MLSDRISKELNEQINAEFWSAYLYLSMSAWFSDANLPGFANWMYAQFKEEQEHGMKIFRYIYEREGKVTLKPIEHVPTSWDSPVDIFKQTLEHERKVTASFNSLMDSAIETKDYATQSFLSWFITEQVEEEATAAGILRSLQDISAQPALLRMLDKELGIRK